jgi:hypothetical protein
LAAVVLLGPADCREVGLEDSTGVRGDGFAKYVDVRGGRFGGR